ncbi:MAG TPA: chemotaxis-specific protein-glutamate methyltransferase CheB [archaeon]|nr:chemotaxis-specific protein-glutamate methyltransferase CheB [archaeon]
MIKVLIVDDSLVVRLNLKYILEKDPDIRVVGAANDGLEAVEMVNQKKPDVVTMDINLPRMSGFLATRRIMETCPVPVVIVSASWDPGEVEKTFLALEAGAVSVVAKPPGIGHPDYEKSANELIKTVKLMSEVKVVTRRPKIQPIEWVPEALLKTRHLPEPAAEIKLVAIGASTGGPVVLQKILAALPTGFPVPILIVQHISAGFLPGMIDWLIQSTGFPVRLATEGEIPQPGHAYLAPDDSHLGVSRNKRISLSDGEKEHNLRPSVSYLFRSVAEVFGPNAAGVLLTGMGSDGAKELYLMKEKGALTIVQDKESSVVFGMPGKAEKIGAARYVLPPAQIAQTLISLI